MNFPAGYLLDLDVLQINVGLGSSGSTVPPPESQLAESIAMIPNGPGWRNKNLDDRPIGIVDV
ncbi:hypothetical protein H9L39_10247 [Fusarium oxysporum f. sp. albedinis]|jgi:hypothetical protein|nr:hypothetical protein FOMA001_g9570 [Fusarium oxysporum f. sp. matthiolae]KAK2477759.1 hypothetical protein H9L39_10247 [Fusarium oxysporum f. sp. albedinis]